MARPRMRYSLTSFGARFWVLLPRRFRPSSTHSSSRFSVTPSLRPAPVRCFSLLASIVSATTRRLSCLTLILCLCSAAYPLGPTLIELLDHGQKAVHGAGPDNGHSKTHVPALIAREKLLETHAVVIVGTVFALVHTNGSP